MFYVGQKVICVNTGPICLGIKNGLSRLVQPPPNTILIKQKYTVSEIGMWFDVPWCHVAEVESPTPFGWIQLRFRPAITTSIETFQGLLKPIKQLEDA